jgi:hypothetical protein
MPWGEGPTYHMGDHCVHRLILRNERMISVRLNSVVVWV